MDLVGLTVFINNCFLYVFTNLSDRLGLLRTKIYFYGVQGVESSNLFAPTNRFKQLANPSGLAFCYSDLSFIFVPNNVPNK